MTRQVPAPGQTAPDDATWSLIRLSASTAEELEQTTQELHGLLRRDPAATATAIASRFPASDRHRHRRVVICRGPADAADVLDNPHPRTVKTAEVLTAHREVAFMFPGGAAQHPGMAGGLYRSRPVFAGQVDACAARFVEASGLDVRDALRPGHEPSLTNPVLGLCSLFTVEYALARLWGSLGVRPAALVGHSLGEYVAATLAGVLSLPDAVRLVAHRARLIAGLPAGMMLTVAAPEQEVAALLRPGIDLAAINGPSQVVVSGASEAVTAFEAELAGRGIGARRLRLAAGGHSSLVDGVLADFERVVATVATGPAGIPCISNVTGTWLTDEQAVDPAYWVGHLRAPVRFADGLGTARSAGPVVLLEVGPGTTLSTLALQNGAVDPAPVSSLPHPLDPRPDTAVLATAMGELWLAGVELDWVAWGGRDGPRGRTGG